MVIKRAIILKEKDINKLSDGKIIGNLFRKYRKEKQEVDSKWTQEYVADQANLDRVHYGKFERGIKKEPQFVTILKLARALDVSLDKIGDDYVKEKSKCEEYE